MNWLAVIAAALGVIRSLIAYLHERRRIDAATAELLLRSNHEAQDAIDQALEAREQVRAAAARNPDVMSDDGYKRDD